MRPVGRILLWVILGGSVIFRLLHLTGPLDEPMWRQADTAYMAVRMMDESPPDLLNPKAPYRGTNDVKAAEFPIYPATVSLVYKVIGQESLPAARMVTLLFFAGAVWLLFLSVRILAGARIAAWTSVFYSIAPLGIVYSRMVHPDAAILFFSHLFLYGLLRFVASGKVWWWIAASIGGTAAFLMKAPYAFFLGLLPGWWWLVQRDKRTPGRLIGLVTVLILPLVAAVWFNHHRIAQEAPFEESLVYPMKWTAESSTGRFFGSVEQRFNPDSWKLIVKRMIYMVMTPLGILLALAGLWPWKTEEVFHAPGGGWGHWVWLFGAGMYVLLVFPMVAGGHEYYTLPLVAPAALLMARGCAGIQQMVQERGFRYPWAVPVTIVIMMLAGTREGLSRGPYLDPAGPSFTVDWQRVHAGEAIRMHTMDKDLVLSITHGRSTGWSDPRILYHADRMGWSIEARTLNDSNLADFVEAGATVAAVLVTPEAEPREEELGPLVGWPYERYDMLHDGKAVGSVRFYRLGAH